MGHLPRIKDLAQLAGMILNLRNSVVVVAVDVFDKVEVSYISLKKVKWRRIKGRFFEDLDELWRGKRGLTFVH